jgi:glycosyltransferase involved in cell wall biosynthesis
MTTLHAVLPDRVDDPLRPSGGNLYDRRALDGLTALGFAVTEHPVGSSWPHPSRADLGRLAAVVELLADGSLLLVDGLVASAAARVLVPQCGRLRVVVLLHMPTGPDPDERAVLTHAATVVTTSEWSRDRIRQWYGVQRACVVHPGVDRARPARGTTLDGVALLCVAAVHSIKGHDLLLDALDELGAWPWSLTCVGATDLEPAYARELREMIRARGWTRRVRWTGPLVGRALDAAYDAADLVVVPSRTESYGMVVAEALARGLPVVAAEVGGIPEALGRAPDGARPGLLVPPRDAHALAGALATWLGQPEMRAGLRAAAADRRPTLAAWTVTADGLADVLNAVAGPAPAGDLLGTIGTVR